MVIFESISRVLLFLHLIAAACVLGSAIHLAIRVCGYCRGRVIKVDQEKLYAKLLVISYSICYLLGAMVYPAFRVNVRADYLDRQLPWATGLFEIKEHFATIGLIAAIATWLISRSLGRSIVRKWLPLYASVIAVVLLTLIYNVWSGWYLVVLKPV